MLNIKHISLKYGAINALNDVSFEVKSGEIVALIGANGAGKTSTLNTISGIFPVISGKIVFQDREISNEPAHKIASLGIAHVPEGRKVFPRMSVLENLEMGAYTPGTIPELPFSWWNKTPIWPYPLPTGLCAGNGQHCFTRRVPGINRQSGCQTGVHGRIVESTAMRVNQVHSRVWLWLLTRNVTVTHLKVTEAKTIVPPTIAHRPGLSPNKRNTQMGFKTGSMIGIKIPSKAVICLIASAYKIYEKPNWNTPKRTNPAHPESPGPD